MFPDWLQGKKIGIFGFGVNNAKLTEWLLKHGATDLVVYDDSKEAESRGQQAREFLSADQVIAGDGALEQATDREVIFRSAGIHPSHPALEAARSRGARITSQTDLFLELCPAKTVGITGTKGKGTTSSLLAHLLDSRLLTIDSRNMPDDIRDTKVERLVYLAGNIGKDPFEFLDELTTDDIVILELSSGQLQDMTHSPNLAVVLEISPDHQDYHASFEEYVEAKRPIVRYQQPGDIMMLNIDSDVARSFADEGSGTLLYFSGSREVQVGGYCTDGVAHFRDPRFPQQEKLVSLASLTLRGPHNQINATAAVTAALILGAPPEAIEARLGSFVGMPHRLEIVPTTDGITWVNDSYGTIQQTVIAAIRSFDGPILLISGGYDKGLDYTQLGRVIAERDLKVLFTIGAIGPKIAAAARAANFAEEKIHEVETLDRAVVQAAHEARSGDTVILAPGSSSFDQFKSYSERGDVFRKLVQNLEAR